MSGRAFRPRAGNRAERSRSTPSDPAPRDCRAIVLRTTVDFRSRYVLHGKMPIKTRGDLLRLDLAMALSKAVKIVRGLRKGLTREEREAVADDAVRRVAAQRGDPWRLNEQLPLPGPAIGHGSPDGWSKTRD